MRPGQLRQQQRFGFFLGELFELSHLLGRPREHMEFTVWYLIHKGLVQRGDQSSLNITVDGVDFLEKNPKTNLQRLRLAERHGQTQAYGDVEDFQAAAAS